MSLTDHELVARTLADDDRHAFGELVRRHQSAVRAFLRRLNAGRHAEADDQAQETFIEAHRSLARYRGDASFVSWLLGIAYNRFRSARRSARDTEEFNENSTDTTASDHIAAITPADATQTEDLKHDLARALDRLPLDERAAIQLCFGEGLSHQEAATVLGTPLGTVKTHVLRAKEKLRTRLRAWAKS